MDSILQEHDNIPTPITQQKKVFAKGYCFFKYFWFFVIGCIVGTYYEQILTLCKKGVWVSRAGLLYGPLNPVYGFGAVLCVLILHRVKDWKLLWTLGGLIGGGFEYILSWLQEIFIHSVSWDYSARFLNLNGRTTIPYMVFWGFLFMVVVKVIYPFCSKWIEKIPYTFGNVMTWICIVLMALNMGITCSALLRQSMRHKGIEARTTFAEWLDKMYPDEVIYDVFENMKPASEKNQLQQSQEDPSLATPTLAVYYGRIEEKEFLLPTPCPISSAT